MRNKLEKRSSEASNKGSCGEDYDKESNHSKEFEDERNPKNDSALNSMLIKHIQSLIADVLKAHLEGGHHGTHRYSKPYMKRIYALLRDFKKNEYSYYEYDAPKMLDKLLEK